jgi:hypothetical protein
MNPLPDSERLLNDVLADESSAGFREALLGETLRLARRRRRWRKTRQIGGALALVAVVAALIWRTLPPRISTPARPAQSYQLVRSRPFPTERIVTTQPVPAGQLAASFAAANLVRTTASSGRYREIGDDELLALAGPRPAALVRLGPHEAELVFIEPVDEEPSRNN